MSTYIPLAVALVFFVIMWFLKRPDITSSGAKELIAAGGRLVDVRSPGEFASGHLPGARNMPVDRLDPASLKPADAPVVLYCASGARSAMAARRLRSAGFTKVYNLGPMRNW